ncbi:hypothetical protein JHW43_003500 [Diplocarpon mali]|nr:hypothetical protein JHW43_003500 [Diplocarpon mali]
MVRDGINTKVTWSQVTWSQVTWSHSHVSLFSVQPATPHPQSEPTTTHRVSGHYSGSNCCLCIARLCAAKGLRTRQWPSRHLASTLDIIHASPSSQRRRGREGVLLHVAACPESLLLRDADGVSGPEAGGELAPGSPSSGLQLGRSVKQAYGSHEAASDERGEIQAW